MQSLLCELSYVSIKSNPSMAAVEPLIMEHEHLLVIARISIPRSRYIARGKLRTSERPEQISPTVLSS